MSFAIVASIAVAGITAAITSSQANKQKKRAQSREQQARDKIAEIEQNRQKITDPSKEVKDLSGMIQNPYFSFYMENTCLFWIEIGVIMCGGALFIYTWINRKKYNNT